MSSSKTQTFSFLWSFFIFLLELFWFEVFGDFWFGIFCQLFISSKLDYFPIFYYHNFIFIVDYVYMIKWSYHKNFLSLLFFSQKFFYNIFIFSIKLLKRSI